MIKGIEKAAECLEKSAWKPVTKTQSRYWPLATAIRGGLAEGVPGGLIGAGIGAVGGGLYNVLARDEEEKKKNSILSDVLYGGGLGGLTGVGIGGIPGAFRGFDKGRKGIYTAQLLGGLPENQKEQALFNAANKSLYAPAR